MNGIDLNTILNGANAGDVIVITVPCQLRNAVALAQVGPLRARVPSAPVTPKDAAR